MNKTGSINYLFGLSVIVSLVFSILLWFFVEEMPGIFVGIWVPTILGYWIFMRLTKVSKIPLKVFFIWTIPTFLSLIFSIILWFYVSQLSGIFVGIWVSTIILFGSIMISMNGARK